MKWDFLAIFPTLWLTAVTKRFQIVQNNGANLDGKNPASLLALKIPRKKNVHQFLNFPVGRGLTVFIEFCEIFTFVNYLKVDRSGGIRGL